ncbi:GntR family transcriptional regulator / MocR family aminotransferase [Pararobbsia alpina]|uniref:MocR-like pyridoxine biosynthesis transcription factor PdxR n=1 Tax=Pararobbsia alpina TaxID=621374 RepID=UPI0039A6BDE3
MNPPLVLSLPLDAPQAGESLHRWLYEGLRQSIVSGRLPADSVLPGTRTLARQFHLSRGTVLAAYDQLLAEGYLVTRVGSGTRVSRHLPDQSAKVSVAPPASVLTQRPVERRPKGPWINRLVEHVPALPLALSDVPPRPFLPHRSDIRAFPIDTWRQLHVRQLRSSRIDALREVNPAGLPALREAIADHLAISRAVSACPEQIVIVSSMQQALDLCMRLVAGPDDAVWMEDPGHMGAREVMLASGARVVDICVDCDGMRVEDGIREAPAAALAYTTPSRHAPLGVSLSSDRRAALLQWAIERDAIVFEDDCDSQYCFAAKLTPALRSLPGASEHVVFTGTFSRLMFPSLRLAYAVLPLRLVEPFKRAAAVTARGANGIAQAVMADFLAEGHFDRHIRRMRKRYASRAQAFETAARRHWQGLIDIPAIEAGLDVVGQLVRHDEAAAVERLAAAGIDASPLARYSARHRHPSSLVMGFAPFDEVEIDLSARRIASALRVAA